MSQDARGPSRLGTGSKWIRLAMWTLVVTVGVVSLLGWVAYKVMVGVKPGGVRTPAPEVGAPELARLEQALMTHVSELAIGIGERNLDRLPALEAAASYIERQFTAFGYTVESEWLRVADASGVVRPCRNLVVERRGTDRDEEIVLVGAHYDTVWDCPGANDNASGVAALLEIARHLASDEPRRRIRLVAFVNEEPPYYEGEAMGSRLHARRARERGDRIVGMLSLETIGYYVDEPGTQNYPAPFSRFYPDAGNFLAVVGDLGSRALVKATLHHFMRTTDLPVEGAATPRAVPGVGWSDHASFWEQGYAGVMLTDTAPFRYPHYHQPTDLPGELNPPSFARAVHGIIGAVRGLADAAGRP